MSIMVSEGVTRKLSDTRLMLIPRPISNITREDDIHYTSPWLSHSPRALSLSPHSHHHTELLPLSPFGMDPNSPFSHFAPNSNHCHPGAQAIITKLSITTSSVLASQPEQPVVVRWEVWSGLRGRKAGLSLTNQLVSSLIQSGTFKREERNLGTIFPGEKPETHSPQPAVFIRCNVPN